MALYTRLWAARKHDSPPVIFQQPSPLTIQAALELINATPTPTHTEIKLAYSLWENQVQRDHFPGKPYFNHQISA